MTAEKQTLIRVETELLHLTRMIHETPFMPTRCSRDMRCLFVSRAYAEMLGREPEEIEGLLMGASRRGTRRRSGCSVTRRQKSWGGQCES
jgi:hypothetical protein